MTRFTALVRLFLSDLVRRRMLWTLVLVTIGLVALNYGTNRVMEESLGRGESWDIATRRASSQLRQVTEMLRGWLCVLVVLLAAQVAPESRRNGTAQFVLSLGVGRGRLAAAQFTALAGLVTAMVLLIHGGVAFTGLRLGAVTPIEAAVAWTELLAPLLGLAAAVFAASLTASPMEVYLVFLGIPLVAGTFSSFGHGVPKWMPQGVVRAVDNVSLFFPSPTDVLAWPHLHYQTVDGPLQPQPAWAIAHLVAAALFWVALGAWLQRHHDFGSRTAVK